MLSRRLFWGGRRGYDCSEVVEEDGGVVSFNWESRKCHTCIESFSESLISNGDMEIRGHGEGRSLQLGHRLWLVSRRQRRVVALFGLREVSIYPIVAMMLMEDDYCDQGWSVLIGDLKSRALRARCQRDSVLSAMEFKSFIYSRCWFDRLLKKDLVNDDIRFRS